MRLMREDVCAHVCGGVRFVYGLCGLYLELSRQLLIYHGSNTNNVKILIQRLVFPLGVHA